MLLFFLILARYIFFENRTWKAKVTYHVRFSKFNTKKYAVYLCQSCIYSDDLKEPSLKIHFLLKCHLLQLSDLKRTRHTDRNVIHLWKFQRNEQEAWFQLIHVETLSRVLNYLPRTVGRSENMGEGASSDMVGIIRSSWLR